MDFVSNLTATPVQKRLETFYRSPLPNDLQLSLSNSPLKLAEAGFMRPQEPTSDEVTCSYCGAEYMGWCGESPQAVHRVLNPKCPYMNTPPSSTSTSPLIESDPDNHRSRIESLRRQLFPDSRRSSSNILADIQHPFKPKHGDYLMLFESHRLLTYNDPGSENAAVYAKDGFIFKIDSGKVVCVYCDLELDFIIRDSPSLRSVHGEKSLSCPFVKLYDVGNVSHELERKIRDKIRSRYLNDDSQSSEASSVHYSIKHPEFEDVEVREGTYNNWLKYLARSLTPAKMAECGFYYTEQDSAAAASAPDSSAAQPSSTSSSSSSMPSSLSTSSSSLSSSSTASPAAASAAATSSAAASPGSPNLDLEAIKAATACGLYPNKDLLLGTLKAADENYKQLCDQRQEIEDTKAACKNKDAELQETKAEKATREAVLQQEILARERELQATRTELQRRGVEGRSDLEQQIQHHREVIEQKNQALEQNRQVIEQKDQALDQKDQVIELKNKEVEDLHRHIRSLMAALQHKEPLSASSDDETSSSDGEHSTLSSDSADSGSSSDVVTEEFPVASCKVCLVRSSQYVFLPCKHMCCCEVCAQRLRGKNCPICRGTTVDVERIYIV
ncbi:baculoviral IAP repeat-containing protein 3-like [Aplysia californica]|uniref:Baculoviral IAP repeat-containing protein 3-like n=1 Tax=Aplysia californica TaxID=6500 RepID=A0ABM0JJX2_APLCA|nr:baculoviral IAP repeat-containing protein 3-like [Aplysia californica]